MMNFQVSLSECLLVRKKYSVLEFQRRIPLFNNNNNDVTKIMLCVSRNSRSPQNDELIITKIELFFD